MIHNERSPDAGTSRAPRVQAIGQRLQREFSGVRLERKLPAYTREVEGLLRAGQPVNAFIFAGARAWDRARLRRDNHGPGSAMVLADDVPPDRWRWPIGLDAAVLAVESVPPGQALAIARAAVAGGVRCVVVCGLDRPAIIRRAVR